MPEKQNWIQEGAVLTLAGVTPEIIGNKKLSCRRKFIAGN